MGALRLFYLRGACGVLLRGKQMKQRLLREGRELGLLLRAIPAHVFAFFALSVFAMNLLANKSISLPVDWLALDCGIIVSWIAFLAMDVITKHFGPKAATILSALALIISLFFCLIFFLASLIGGVWGESYVSGSEDVINAALNNTFGGTWYVLLGSAAAFLVSSVVNNFLNWTIGKAFKRKPDGMAAYAARAYLSTAAGQFVDNIVFALLVSRVFFGWSMLQCITCSLTGMLAELLCEVIFSPVGFAVCKKWKKENVGAEYFEYRNKESSL